MDTHTPMMRAGRPAPSVRGKHAKGGPRTGSPRENAVRMLLTALVLAALAASSAALAGHTGGPAAGHSLIGSRYILNTPWMY
jgi:hypothetical protein